MILTPPLIIGFASFDIPVGYFSSWCFILCCSQNSSWSLNGNLTAIMTYEGCPESIRPFWISREPVARPWCNLAAGQRRPYCASVNINSPVRLISQQWDSVDWACVVCDRRIHESPPFQRRFYLWGKPEVAGRQIWSVRGLADLGDVMFC